MNDKVGELFEQAIEEWRINKGIGTAIIPSKLNDKTLILGILQRVYSKPNFGRTFIITNTFDERAQLVEFLTHQKDSEENNEEFKKLIDNKSIKVVSKNLVESNLFTLNGIFSLVILYHIDEISNPIEVALRKGKFKLVIINKLLNDEDRTKLYTICPLLNVFKQNEVEAVRLSTPVEEMLMPIEITSEKDAKTLKWYNDYISASISIFGDLATMDKARIGDKITNQSAEAICRQIAKDNGWSKTLDMSIEYNKQIDILFNPNALYERAKNTYNTIRERTNFLTDYKDKIRTVCEIVENNIDKKILIISKRGDFANIISNYLNTNCEVLICKPFHDKLTPIIELDEYGHYVTYKSGTKAGKPKEIGTQAQCTKYMSMFNNGFIRCLSVSNSPDKRLNIDVDIVIITSPLCNTIEEYLYRLDKIKFNSPIKLYTLYVTNSLEQRQLEKRKLPVSHVLLNNIKNDIAYDKNNDVVIVD